jgi:ribosomal protein S8
MPDFDYDGYVDIDVDDFIRACNSREIEEVIDELIEGGYIKSSQVIHVSQKTVAEQIFQEALQKLDGKWNLLTKEEEEIITNISKRF